MNSDRAQCTKCGAYTLLPAQRCRKCGTLFEETAPIEEPGQSRIPVPLLPPPVVPVLGELTAGKAFFLGLAAGIVPLALAALVAGGFAVFFTGWALVVILGVGAVICFRKRRWRWLGYGLLAMACVSPVVAFIGCLTAITLA
jgi:hypothetical protein